MKLRSPFTISANPIRDLDRINDLADQVVDEKLGDYWEQECKLNPAKSTCKLYEV